MARDLGRSSFRFRFLIPYSVAASAPRLPDGRYFIVTVVFATTVFPALSSTT